MSYKSYEQNQILLLPPSLDELVPENDLARVINEFAEGLSSSIFVSSDCESASSKCMFHVDGGHGASGL